MFEVFSDIQDVVDRAAKSWALTSTEARQEWLSLRGFHAKWARLSYHNLPKYVRFNWEKHVV